MTFIRFAHLCAPQRISMSFSNNNVAPSSKRLIILMKTALSIKHNFCEMSRTKLNRIFDTPRAQLEVYNCVDVPNKYISIEIRFNKQSYCSHSNAALNGFHCFIPLSCPIK